MIVDAAAFAEDHLGAVRGSHEDAGVLLSEVEAAARFLDREPWPLIADAELRLQAVEALLGYLACDPPVSVPEAQRFLYLRDELSVHLSAATTLTSLGLHAGALRVLHRAISVLRPALLSFADRDAADGGGS